jgi:hypothetical protein
MIYFSDVDVVLKLAACGLLPRLAELLGLGESELEVRHLVSMKSRVKRLATMELREHLEVFCEKHTVVKGTADLAREQELLDGGVDPGEALLFAEAEATGGVVVTGDKRALAAYAKLSTPKQRAKIKVVCWEQLLLRCNRLYGYETLREACCQGLEQDKGLLSIVFSSGLATPEEHALEGIRSYLTAVTKHSGDILLELEI